MKRNLLLSFSSRQMNASVSGVWSAVACTSSPHPLSSFRKTSSSSCSCSFSPPPACGHRIFCRVPPALSRKLVVSLSFILILFCYYLSIACISVSATSFFHQTFLGAFRISFFFVSCTSASMTGRWLPGYFSDDSTTSIYSGHEGEGGGAARGKAAAGATEEEERNNWAVIVSASRYWHNYRHTSNALTIYFAVKRLGVPDSRIILMLADDHACSPRNPFPGQIFNSPRRWFNLFGVTALRAAAVQQRQAAFEQAAIASAAVQDAARLKASVDTGEEEESKDSDLEKRLQKISSFFASSSFTSRSSGSASSSFPSSTSLSEDVEVDYRGEEVHVQALLRLLTGRHAAETPRGQRLLSDNRSHVLVYLTGHGGEKFLKFQDWEEIGAVDLADAVAQMQQQQRYKRLLLIAETCQGSTLLDSLYSPNVLGLASSKLDEGSYSHHADSALGVSVVDRWTYYTLAFFQKYILEGNGRSSNLADEATGSRQSKSSRSKRERKKQQPRNLFSEEDEEEEKDEEDEEGDEQNETEEEMNRSTFINRSQRTEGQPDSDFPRGRVDERQRMKKREAKTIADLMASYQFRKLLSTATARADLFDKPLEETTLDEFFSAATGVVVPTLRPYWLPFSVEKEESKEVQQQRQQEEKRTRKEQQRLRDSSALFRVPSYYGEAFLCLLCDTGRGMRDLSRGRQQQQLQQEEENVHRRERYESGGKSEKEKAAAVATWKSTNAEEEEVATRGRTSVTSHHQYCRRGASTGKMLSKDHIYAIYKSELTQWKQGEQEQRQPLQSFSGILHAAAAGAAAFLTAAAAAFLF